MACRLLVAAIVLVGIGAPRPALADPTDFVVQQVCVDAADKPAMGDPAHCPKARKLRIGEAIPYRRVDAGNWQALYSYPVRGLAGETRAIAEKVFGGADTSGSFGDLGQRSGYDLLEVGPDYVSGIRTSDPGGGDQIFWRTVDCVRSDGWIMFPPDLGPGRHGEARSTLKITPGPSTECPRLNQIAPDFTAWERPAEPYRYTSGKRLDTIMSMHFAYGDPADPAHDDDSMEKFYFTNIYGFSRWEAWETPAGCNKRAQRAGTDPAATCRPSSLKICSGPNTATFYGKLYLRLDCRDSTFYVADTDRAFNPLVSDAAPGDVLSRNLLANGSFADGTAAWQAAGERPPTLAAAREPRSNNAVLRVSGPSGETSVSQDFTIPPPIMASGRSLRWGVTLTAADGPAKATLILTLGHDGAPPEVSRHAVDLGASSRAVAFTLPLPESGGQPLQGRFELRLEGPVDVTVDDAFAAVLDRAASP